MGFNSYRRLDLGRPDLDLVCECSVDWTHRGDLYKPLSLRFVELSFQMDLAMDLVEHSRFGLAVLAVLCVDTAVAEGDFDALQGDPLPLRIHAECHRRSGPECD